MDLRFNIREIKKAEIFLLNNFLYEAIFIPQGQAKPNIGIIQLPELFCYIKDFGKASDFCLVAESQGNLIGAIWSRIFTETEKGYGYVDSKTPELSMSVKENFRQKGAGAKLLLAMIVKLAQLHYEQVSLSVDKQNYAFKMYLKFGFEIVKSDEKSAIMIKRLKE